MSFFGLFKKKEKPPKPQEEVSPHIDTPWGPFYYNGIKYNNYDYEGMVDWYDDIDDPCDVSIETNAVGSDDVSEGLERFAQLMNNKADIDYQVKMTALEQFADESGLVMSASKDMLMSKELFLDTMFITCITLYRDGRMSFHFYDCDFPHVESLTVLYNAKGESKVKVLNYGEPEGDFYSDDF